MQPLNRKSLASVMLAFILLMSAGGCVQGKFIFTVNPNRSGKVDMDVVMPPQSRVLFGGSGGASLEKMLERTAATVLGRGKGVTAWENVTIDFRKDGKIRFKGTAYFKDIRELNLQAVPVPSPDLQNQNGKLAITIRNRTSDPKTNEIKRPNPRNMSDQDLSRYVLLQRAQYQQVKGIYQAMLTDLRLKATYRLPGKVTSVQGFQRDGDRAVKFEINGQEYLQEFQKLMSQSDKLLKAQLRTRGNFLPFDDGGDYQELPKFFRKLQNAKAIIAKASGPQFDYDSAVTAARKEYPQLKKKLKIDGKSRIRLPGDPNAKPRDAKKEPR